MVLFIRPCNGTPLASSPKWLGTISGDLGPCSVCVGPGPVKAHSGPLRSTGAQCKWKMCNLEQTGTPNAILRLRSRGLRDPSVNDGTKMWTYIFLLDFSASACWLRACCLPDAQVHPTTQLKSAEVVGTSALGPWFSSLAPDAFICPFLPVPIQW